jgi:hypothetical protein
VWHPDIERTKLFDQSRNPNKPSTHVQGQSGQLLVDPFVQGFNRPFGHGESYQKRDFCAASYLEATLPHIAQIIAPTITT